MNRILTDPTTGRSLPHAKFEMLLAPLRYTACRLIEGGEWFGIDLWTHTPFLIDERLDADLREELHARIGRYENTQALLEACEQIREADVPVTETRSADLFETMRSTNWNCALVAARDKGFTNAHIVAAYERLQSGDQSPYPLDNIETIRVSELDTA